MFCHVRGVCKGGKRYLEEKKKLCSDIGGEKARL